MVLLITREWTGGMKPEYVATEVEGDRLEEYWTEDDSAFKFQERVQTIDGLHEFLKRYFEIESPQTWDIWTLSRPDITNTAEEMGVVLTDKEIEEVAGFFKKGVEALLNAPYDWTDILKESIEVVKE